MFTAAGDRNVAVSKAQTAITVKEAIMQTDINWKREIIVLLEKINDEKTLRRVWKILMAALGH